MIVIWLHDYCNLCQFHDSDNCTSANHHVGGWDGGEHVLKHPFREATNQNANAPQQLGTYCHSLLTPMKTPAGSNLLQIRRWD